MGNRLNFRSSRDVRVNRVTIMHVHQIGKIKVVHMLAKNTNLPNKKISNAKFDLFELHADHIEHCYLARVTIM